MGDVQTVLLLLIAAAVLVRLADLAHLPAPIVLVVGGLAPALVLGLPRVDLPPDTVSLLVRGRTTLRELHGYGRLNNAVLREIQRDLDLEEARLRA